MCVILYTQIFVKQIEQNQNNDDLLTEDKLICRVRWQFFYNKLKLLLKYTYYI